MIIAELLRAVPPNPQAITELLNGMTHEDRVRATRTLPRRLFADLFDLFEAAPIPRLEQMVPAGTEAFREVHHIGVNNMPLFRMFEKPMYRNREGSIGGRNAQFWSWLTGPGYFVVDEPAPQGNEIVFDYVNLPADKPDHWPKITSNSRGFSVFVYRGMIDYVRVVSEHVTIGKAFRHGKEQGAYFILVRLDDQPTLPGAKKALPPVAGD